MVAQFIHGTQYIDELVMMRAADKGDLYVHQGERSERKRAAIGTADRDVRDRPATCPQGDRTTRSTGGANFNVIGVILDTRPTRSVTVLHTAAEGGPRVKDGSLIERYVLEPYGQLTVHQLSSYGDRDGDGDVDATDKGTPGTTCTGTPTAACRILDFDNDYDASDATLFDNLDAGNAVHPGRRSSALGQHFGHQGLWLDAEAGQYQNRARWYGSLIRRFGQRDRLTLRSMEPFMSYIQLQLYTYVANSPTNYLDPGGLIKAKPPSFRPLTKCCKAIQVARKRCDRAKRMCRGSRELRDEYDECCTETSGYGNNPLTCTNWYTVVCHPDCQDEFTWMENAEELCIVYSGECTLHISVAMIACGVNSINWKGQFKFWLQSAGGGC